MQVVRYIKYLACHDQYARSVAATKRGEMCEGKTKSLEAALVADGLGFAHFSPHQVRVSNRIAVIPVHEKLW